MQTLRPPAATSGSPMPPVAPARASRRYITSGRGWLDVLLVAGVTLLALAVRWPHLWTVPRFTDETLEVLHSLAIVRDGARPLTNYDSYYGALYNYLVAGALWALGENPLVPRLVVLAGGALTVAATYLLGRELAYRFAASTRADRQDPTDLLPTRPPRGRAEWDLDLVPRAAGALAALLLAVNGAHVVVNSHIAWSNCLTPLFTTLAFWALLRADLPAPLPFLRQKGETAGRAPSSLAGQGGRGVRFLALAGLLFGLALQTHPLVVALLPGVAVYVLWRGREVWWTPWPYLALVMFILGYGNVLVHNWQTDFESLRSAQRIQAEYALDQQATVGYLPTLGAMLLLLARVLGGAVDQRGGATDYLADPFVLLSCVLVIVGVTWQARRGESLPLLVAISFLLLLPLLNSKFRTLLTARYLMPIVPLLFAATAASLVHAARGCSSARPGRAASAARCEGEPPGRPRAESAHAGTAHPAFHRARLPVAIGAAAALMLVFAPLQPLGHYYARAFERSDTNERILRLSGEIASARRTDEPVLIDEAIGTELPDTGVTELRGLEYLLAFARVPHRAIRVTSARLQQELGDGTALAVLNARDATAASERLAVVPIDPRPPAETGRRSDYRVYRIQGPGARGWGAGGRGRGAGTGGGRSLALDPCPVAPAQPHA